MGQNTDDKIQRTDGRGQKIEVGLRPVGAIRGLRPGGKDWKTDIRFYFYSINLFNPVN
jgi:hypothetical protein